MRTRLATAVALAAGLSLVVTVAAPDAGVLARSLGADKADVRDDAARQLLAMGSSAEPALTEAAASGSPATKRRARALLALIDDGEDAPDARKREAEALVTVALRSTGRVAADGAADLRLGELGGIGARAIARAAETQTAQGFLRPEMGDAIARHPSPEAVSALAGALRGDRVLGSTLVEVARSLEAAPVVAITDDARGALEAVLEVPSDPRRRGAAALLVTLDDEATHRFVDDADPRVRIEAAHALRRHPSAAAGNALERLAQDNDRHVRRAALAALLEMPGRPRAAPAHANADHPDAGVRAAAAELLVRDAVPASMSVLHRLSNDRSIRVRVAAKRSLVSIRRARRAAQK